jgi:hypothetical protein
MSQLQKLALAPGAGGKGGQASTRFDQGSKGLAKALAAIGAMQIHTSLGCDAGCCYKFTFMCVIALASIRIIAAKTRHCAETG